jgi:hypothetical protein
MISRALDSVFAGISSGYPNLRFSLSVRTTPRVDTLYEELRVELQINRYNTDQVEDKALALLLLYVVAPMHGL